MRYAIQNPGKLFLGTRQRYLAQSGSDPVTPAALEGLCTAIKEWAADSRALTIAEASGSMQPGLLQDMSRIEGDVTWYLKHLDPSWRELAVTELLNTCPEAMEFLVKLKLVTNPMVKYPTEPGPAVPEEPPPWAPSDSLSPAAVPTGTPGPGRRPTPGPTPRPNPGPPVATGGRPPRIMLPPPLTEEQPSPANPPIPTGGRGQPGRPVPSPVPSEQEACWFCEGFGYYYGTKPSVPGCLVTQVSKDACEHLVRTSNETRGYGNAVPQAQTAQPPNVSMQPQAMGPQPLPTMAPAPTPSPIATTGAPTRIPVANVPFSPPAQAVTPAPIATGGGVSSPFGQVTQADGGPFSWNRSAVSISPAASAQATPYSPRGIPSLPGIPGGGGGETGAVTFPGMGAFLPQVRLRGAR